MGLACVFDGRASQKMGSRVAPRRATSCAAAALSLGLWTTGTRCAISWSRAAPRRAAAGAFQCASHPRFDDGHPRLHPQRPAGHPGGQPAGRGTVCAGAVQPCPAGQQCPVPLPRSCRGLRISAYTAEPGTPSDDASRSSPPGPPPSTSQPERRQRTTGNSSPPLRELTECFRAAATVSGRGSRM